MSLNKPQGPPQHETRGSDLCTEPCLTLLGSLRTDRGGKTAEKRKKDEQESAAGRNQVANQAG